MTDEQTTPQEQGNNYLPKIYRFDAKGKVLNVKDFILLELDKRSTLEEGKIVLNYTDYDIVGTYTSPDKCKGCHAEEYEAWCKTKYAVAMKTLVNKKRLIADCLPCHSEEYKTTSKISHSTPSNAPCGAECATCHASVPAHNESGPAKTATYRVDPKLCTSCHNSVRSPSYE